MRLERTTNSSNIMGSATGSSKRGGIIAHKDGQYVRKKIGSETKMPKLYINEKKNGFQKRFIPDSIGEVKKDLVQYF